MPLIKRVFHVNCSGEECLKIAEIIRENITVTEVHIDIKDYGLVIEIYGYKSDVKNAWNKIKKLVAMYKNVSRTIKGGEVLYPVEYIVSLIKKTFPPLLLVEVLKRKGYSSRYEDGKIITNAEIEEVKSIAEKIADIINEIRYDVKGTTSKYFVAAASILLGLEPSEVIEKAINHGLMYLDEDEKARIRYEWRQALDKFVKIFSRKDIEDRENVLNEIH